MKQFMYMLACITLFWYCFDDWLAASLHTPWVGNVPFFVWLIAMIATGALSSSENE